MRRRSTFVHDPNAVVNHDSIELVGGSLHITSLPAARQERLTFSFNELPQEVCDVHTPYRYCSWPLLTSEIAMASLAPVS